MRIAYSLQPNTQYAIRNTHLSLTLILLLAALLTACQPQPTQIFIEVDGARQSLTTEAGTVREALNEAEVEVGPLDRVTPDLYVQLEPGLVIKIVRITEEIETEREIIPFERQTVVNEGLASGESRLAQLGANGEDEISIRVVYEDGEEVSRTEISRVTVIEPVPEILVVGPQDTLPTVPVDGTIAYLSNGNAWLMRDSNTSRRALTTEGNLDGRVFSLSPDGRRLLYTTALTAEMDLPLNELWLASTTIVGEKPITVGVQGLLHAEWSPIITDTRIAYSTAERTASSPGWRANNDIWLLDLADAGTADELPEPVEILPANTQGQLAWWGATFVWSPDGRQLAYARPDQIGVIDLDIEAQSDATDRITPLIDFAPLQTFSDWAWVPGISWSPDSEFIAATVHGPPLASESAEESQVFDLWLFSADGSISAKVAEQVGMWANPVWGEAGIAFGEAISPLQSVNSRYNIVLMDRDGSNRRQIFPFQAEVGVQSPEIVWSPDDEDLLFIYNGNLHISSRAGGLPKQLSTDGQASHPRWALAQPPAITETVTITGSQPITASSSVTDTSLLTATITPETSTPTVTQTRRPTGTPSPTATPTRRPTATTRPTFTRTPRFTATATPSATSRRATSTSTPSLTPTETDITLTPTVTPTRRSTATPTQTATSAGDR